MNKIAVSIDQARSDISNARSQINSQLNALVNQYSTLSSRLNESSGATVTSLKEQLTAEQELVKSSIDFLLKLCDSLEEAAQTYADQDNKLSREIG